MIQIILLLYTLAQVAVANVEKIIFTGPPASTLPSAITARTISSLNIHTLTHDVPSIHTELKRIFASTQSGLHGKSSWVSVQNLTENQRYEMRVCWSALEPTRFDIKIHTLDAVAEDPALFQSINAFSASRQDAQVTEESAARLLDRSSSLLIEIQAAADYFTDDKELMSNPPPVLVDLILDPFLLNVLPRSLLPTVGYLLLVGVTTWSVARWIASGLQSAATSPASKLRKEE
ncbi:hypothetical protein E4U42_000886 [Claviceps africana]|uniref:Uncharacterized protein n=1 Tax=Claviceps africana TaxID=83212 RepID=A0A8K0IZM8_9HYPO|nr:hypothetical protein E4U42_000886 [Claviceps africana]